MVFRRFSYRLVVLICISISSYAFSDLLEQGTVVSEAQCELDKVTPSCPAATTIKYLNLDNKSVFKGTTSLHFEGDEETRSLRVIGSLSVPVKSNALYKISAKIRHVGRKCYNYLSYDYKTENKFVSDVIANKSSNTGIWCGEYSINLFDQTQNVIRVAKLSQPQSHDSQYVRTENLEWFNLSNTFRTGNKVGNALLQFDIKGFDGEIFIDDLEINEITASDDSYLSIPIEGEPFGMKIIDVIKSGISKVETTQSIFEFDGVNNDRNIFKAYKKTDSGRKLVTTVRFPIDTFSTLNLEDISSVEGLIKGETSNYKFSIGADSSLLIKAKQAGSISITGLENIQERYSRFEAGVIFESDTFNKYGFFFAPIQGLNSKRLVSTLRPLRDAHFADDEAEKAGVKNYSITNMSDGILSEGWEGTYSFLPNEYFFLSIFPPKEWKDKSQCNKNLSTPSRNPLIHTTTQVQEAVDALSVNHQMAFLYMGYYDYVENTSTEPNLYYFLNRKVTVENGVTKIIYPEEIIPPVENAPTCSLKSEPCKVPIRVKRDVAGKNYIIDTDRVKVQNFINAAHDKNLKAVAYLSPNFRFTPDSNEILENVSRIVNEYGMDGVYYDGRLPADPLETLKLTRLTRNILGADKIFIQHESPDIVFTSKGDKYRVPAFDAYADLMFLGEHRFSALDYRRDRLVCPALWRMFYTGIGLSNTPSMLTREIRYIDEGNGVYSPMTAEEVVKTQLLCGGIIYMPPVTVVNSPFIGLNSDVSNYPTADYYPLLKDVCSSPPEQVIPTPTVTPTQYPSCSRKDEITRGKTTLKSQFKKGRLKQPLTRSLSKTKSTSKLINIIVKSDTLCSRDQKKAIKSSAEILKLIKKRNYSSATLWRRVRSLVGVL